MAIDQKTLLFSLVIINALMAASLLVATRGQHAGRRREGLAKWAVAVLLEALVWVLITARGAIPDFTSIVVANGLKATVHALALAAIFEFQQRRCPRWQWLLPIGLAMLMAWLQVDDLRARIFWGSLVYGGQLAFLAHALRAHPDTRDSGAGRLLAAGVYALLAVLGARAIMAIGGFAQLEGPFASGTPHPVQMVVYLAILATSVMGSMSFVLMVKQRSDREILQLAMIDSLTQVFNRHALMARAEEELARRTAHPVAFLMIDVDHFKRINDSHGHPVGDDVLCRIVRLLAARLRRCDVLARYGGEEFCVIAPDTDLEGARTLAEALRETVAASPVVMERGDIAATISIGLCVARHGSAALSVRDILANADAALYVAKQAGRNRVAVCAHCLQAEAAGLAQPAHVVPPRPAHAAT